MGLISFLESNLGSYLHWIMSLWSPPSYDSSSLSLSRMTWMLGTILVSFVIVLQLVLSDVSLDFTEVTYHCSWRNVTEVVYPSHCILKGYMTLRNILLMMFTVEVSTSKPAENFFFFFNSSQTGFTWKQDLNSSQTGYTWQQDLNRPSLQFFSCTWNEGGNVKITWRWRLDYWSVKIIYSQP